MLFLLTKVRWLCPYNMTKSDQNSSNYQEKVAFNTAWPPVLLFQLQLSTWAMDAERVWNVMVHAQKPDFVFRRNRRIYLNRQGASVRSTTGSRGVRISGSNAGYTMFRGSVKSTGYPPHSPVSPSLPLPCATVCHHISTALYNNLTCCEAPHSPTFNMYQGGGGEYFHVVKLQGVREPHTYF